MSTKLNFLGGALALLVAGSAVAQAPPPKDRAGAVKVVKVEGDVGFLPAGSGDEADWQPLTVGTELAGDYEFHTAAKGEAQFELPDGHSLVVTELSEVRLLVGAKGRRFDWKLAEGELYATSRPGVRANFAVHTASASVSVLGTSFAVAHDRLTMVTTVSVEEGKVVVTPKLATLKPVTLRAKQKVEVGKTAIGKVQAVVDETPAPAAAPSAPASPPPPAPAPPPGN
jgi:ferric-dicitrate binding protein FerR (iron transport regulator)